MGNTFTQELRCTTCAYPMSGCRCRSQVMRGVSVLTGQTVTITRPAKASAAPELIATARDMRPLLDEILDATQKHMAGFTEAMPASVQAKRETQKRLPIVQAPIVKPAKRQSLSDLAALL